MRIVLHDSPISKMIEIESTFSFNLKLLQLTRTILILHKKKDPHYIYITINNLKLRTQFYQGPMDFRARTIRQQNALPIASCVLTVAKLNLYSREGTQLTTVSTMPVLSVQLGQLP